MFYSSKRVEISSTRWREVLNLIRTMKASGDNVQGEFN